MERKLRQLDLNLLLVLRDIVETKSVTETAARLGVTQPAVSNSLAKLRHFLGDQILVRGSKGNILTIRAEHLYETLNRAMTDLESIINPSESFKPAHTTRRFTIALTDYAEVSFAPGIVAAFRQFAPNARLGIRRLPTYTPVDQLSKGLLDVCVTFGVEDFPGLRAVRLINDKFVSIAHKNHPIHLSPVTREIFAKYTHGLVSPIVENPDDEFSGIGDERLEKHKLKRFVAVSVPHFHLAFDMVRRSDLIFTLPKRLADTAMLLGDLKIFETPIDMPIFETNLVWHQRADADQGVQWLRKLIVVVLKPETTLKTKGK